MRWVVVGLAVVLTISAASSIRPGIVGLFHDDGIYAVVGKSISEGAGYRIISLPGSPAQTKYPFLYSTLLAATWSLTQHWARVAPWLRAVNLLAYLALLLGAWRLLRQLAGLGDLAALAFIVVLGTNAGIVSYVDLALSDLLFLALATWAIALHAGEGSGGREPGIWFPALAVGLGCLTRETGLALVAAGLAHFAFRRSRRDLFRYAGLVGLLVLPWFIWKAWVPSPATGLEAYYTGYESPALAHVLREPALAAEIVWSNFFYFAQSIDQRLLLQVLPALRWVVYPLMGVGALTVVRRSPVFLPVFVAVYLVGILNHPFHPHRYVLPMLPILLVCLFAGIDRLIAGAQRVAVLTPIRPVANVVLALPVALLSVSNLFWFSLFVERSDNGPVRAWYGGQFSYAWGGFSETFEWIRTNTREGDVLATAYDPMYYLYTGRQGIRPWIHNPETYFYPRGHVTPYLGDPAIALRELDAFGVAYLVIDPLDGYSEKPAAPAFFGGLLAEYGVASRLVFVSRDGLHCVYALKKGARVPERGALSPTADPAGPE